MERGMASNHVIFYGMVLVLPAILLNDIHFGVALWI